MKTPSPDGRRRKINKTDQRLLGALLLLMEKKRFADITIKEIAQQAGVDRRTFYRHFASKLALFEAQCQLVFADFGAYMRERKPSTYGFALAYFEFWSDHRAFVGALHRHDLMHHFRKHYDRYMLEVARREKAWGHDPGFADFSPEIRNRFFFGMGGLWGMCEHWIAGGCSETTEELAQYLIAYVVQSYEREPACRYYDQHGTYPFDPCYIAPSEEPPGGWT